MDPEQFVAQLAELRTQNSCIKHCSKCNNSKVSNKVSSKSRQICHSLLRRQWERQCWPQQVQQEPIQLSKGLGKPPPLKNTEGEPWSERRLDMGRGMRIGNSGRSERSNGSRDASGHSRMLADQLCAVLVTFLEGESFDILVGSGSGEGLEAWRRLTLGPLDDWKSERIAQRNPFPPEVPSWSSCREQWNDWKT